MPATWRLFFEKMQTYTGAIDAGTFLPVPTGQACVFLC
jgi:hypothetical protein